MNAKKKALLALFVLIILLGGFLVARGYPDWALNVMQKEGTTFVVTGSVDANITNTEINAYVTNTTITIEPSEGAEFIIKPAAAAVFNIQGQVDANITNTELDVHVTNSTITITPEYGTVFEIRPATGVVFNIQGSVDANITNTELDVHVTNSTITITPEAEAVFEIKPSTGAVFNIQGDVNITNTELDVHVTNSMLNVTGDVNATIQGTASVSIDNATIEVGVATVKERASEENKLVFEAGGLNIPAGGSASKVGFTNTYNETLYLEMITFSLTKSSSSAPDINPYNYAIYFKIEDESGVAVVGFDANPCHSPLNFDPAIPIKPGWRIVVYADSMQDTAAGLDYTFVLRKG